MEIVLLVNVCSVYLKAWSWDRSKKIITSILKSEAAHSAVHEDAWDITVEEEPKLEG
ncbi:hypothetical protein YC2023_098406 [Brassica napus]|uniref:Uncharacterized protein n=2 Tax=Brassica TaxID=3705 RepID=A0A3P6FPA8_BRAOL|nr:unnamed protein product [Brassica napus]VDD54210.1 unnamed protein product [Brassica oleracea]